MRLGDASNFSHGRTSASTFDDGFSGKADAASSASSNSGEESDTTEQQSLPTSHPKLKVQPSIEELNHPTKRQRRLYDDILPQTQSVEPSSEEGDVDYEEGQAKSEPSGLETQQKPKASRGKKAKNDNHPSKLSKLPKYGSAGTKKGKQPPVPGFQAPMSPASLSTQSRKASVTSLANPTQQLGPDEDDLSSKPRCQRCRKSKKGCDRQRPCQRCKDAGIGIEGCVSEDEGNGRKGRYGRHMGITVKKVADATTAIDDESEAAGAILSGMATGQAATAPGASKKRKR